jgi:phosphomannomutase
MGAVIGGEGNGGVINPDLHAGRDALVGAAMFLQLLTELDMTVSEYRATLPHFEMSKQKVELREMTVNADELLEQVTERFKDEKITTIDGLKIDFEEGWVHLRKSNTEPIVRVYSEAATKAEAEALAKRVVEL